MCSIDLSLNGIVAGDAPLDSELRGTGSSSTSLPIGQQQFQNQNQQQQQQQLPPQQTLPPGTKRLACSNCRRRRKKCDLTFPCGNCMRLKLTCNINGEDLRKKRYAASYVKSLESHIAYLENSFRDLVEKVCPEDSPIRRSLMLDDVISGIMSPPHTGSPQLAMEQQSTNDGSRASSVKPILDFVGTKRTAEGEGPFEDAVNKNKKKKTFSKGSLYPDDSRSQSFTNLAPAPTIMAFGSSTSSTASNSVCCDVASDERIADLNNAIIVRPTGIKDQNSLNNDPRILESLSNFYRWLYPGHFIFLHRESFLYGFFNHAKNDYLGSPYCSVELIYAMCAVGSRLSTNLQHTSEEYYEKAKTALLKLVFDDRSVARITTVQALFCLAFYELGKGDNQLAWYFSGLAIRVGYEMGFQLDPEVWITADDDIVTGRTKLTKSELRIRSRIYWGCYIADHLISLLLGRTTSLSVSNSTIPESDELPEIDGVEDFRFASQHVLQVASPLKNLIILSRIVQIFTSKIFIDTFETEQKMAHLTKFNLKVFQWRQSLPDFLKWSQEKLRNHNVSTDPTISYFWYLYYVVLLTFNKPFIEDCVESKAVVGEVVDDIKILFDGFRLKFGGFQKASLCQLYACLLAINCLIKLTCYRDVDNVSCGTVFSARPCSHTAQCDNSLSCTKRLEQLSFFSCIFHQHMSPAFGLPKRLQKDTRYNSEQEKQTVNQVCNSNYIHDFTLSNEIDDMIKQLFG
ncbi:related to TY1 enhancer activator [Zygosaccharomyces bailii]|nr:related to TY1 enhancer activator [Zygosaccharomyces bailii]